MASTAWDCPGNSWKLQRHRGCLSPKRAHQCVQCTVSIRSFICSALPCCARCKTSGRFFCPGRAGKQCAFSQTVPGAASYRRRGHARCSLCSNASVRAGLCEPMRRGLFLKALACQYGTARWPQARQRLRQQAEFLGTDLVKWGRDAAKKAARVDSRRIRAMTRDAAACSLEFVSGAESSADDEPAQTAPEYVFRSSKLSCLWRERRPRNPTRLDCRTYTPRRGWRSEGIDAPDSWNLQSSPVRAFAAEAQEGWTGADSEPRDRSRTPLQCRAWTARRGWRSELLRVPASWSLSPGGSAANPDKQPRAWAYDSPQPRGARLEFGSPLEQVASASAPGPGLPGAASGKDHAAARRELHRRRAMAHAAAKATLAVAACRP